MERLRPPGPGLHSPPPRAPAGRTSSLSLPAPAGETKLFPQHGTAKPTRVPPGSVEVMLGPGLQLGPRERDPLCSAQLTGVHRS